MILPWGRIFKDREERVPSFPPMNQPICRMLLLCALCAGCAGPSRTFVEENEQKPVRTETEPSERKSSAAPVPPASAPNHPEPSVWSKWVGALVPIKKPAERIPLPRTDNKTAQP